MKYIDEVKETNRKDAILFLVKYTQKLELETNMTHFILYKLTMN